MRRRDLLHAFLGAPVALAACRGKRTPGLPDGALVHRSDQLGHRIRDHRGALEPAADAWETIDTVIVGGGVAGLSAAWRLRRANVTDFVVLELDDVIGGTAKSGRAKTGGYPWGAHYITAPLKQNRALIKLLAEMSVLDGVDKLGDPVIKEQYLCRDPSERVFYYGRWYEGTYLHAGATAEDRRQLKLFEHLVGKWAAKRDGSGRRAFNLPMALGSDDAEVAALDRMSMAAWMALHKLDSPRLRWYVDYACRDDYGLRPQHTSAWAGLLYFAARLASAEGDYRPVVTWPEGNGKLVQHLGSSLGQQRVRPGWAVAELRPTADGVDIVAITDGGKRLRGVRAKRVIFSAPHFVARYLIRDWRTTPPKHVADFHYGSWVVANLHVKGRPGGRGFPLSWDNIIYRSPALGYVVSTHQRGLDHGPTVLTYYYPVLAETAVKARKLTGQLGWKEWAEIALTDLERAHPDVRRYTKRIDIARYGHAMIQPRPGFVWGGSRAAAATPYRGIHFAHSDLSGVALFEEAFYRGVLAGEAVLTKRGVAHESLL